MMTERQQRTFVFIYYYLSIYYLSIYLTNGSLLRVTLREDCGVNQTTDGQWTMFQLDDDDDPTIWLPSGILVPLMTKANFSM